MTPDEAIEKARWFAREDIATTLREEANVLADEVERLRERVGALTAALELCDDALVCDPVFDGDHWCGRCDDSVDRNGEARKAARAALKGSP